VSGNKNKWSTFKEMLFTYLAVTKILYWFNTIVALHQDDLESVGRAVLMRLVSQDILIIVIVILLYFLEKHIALKKSRYSKFLESVVMYLIGYVVLVSIYYVNYLAMRQIMEDVHIYWGEFFIYSFGGYIVIFIVLNIKEYLKPKPAPTAHTVEDKLTMLSALLDANVLTQEEYDQKKAILLAV